MPEEPKAKHRERGAVINPDSKKIRGTKKSDLWKDEYYVKIYELARQGLPDSQIAAALGVDRSTFWSWKTGNKAVALAMAQARSLAPTGTEKFLDYVYGRLDPELYPIWHEIMLVQESKSTAERVEAMLARKGEYARKNIFIHALVHYNFNASHACQAAGVSKGLLEYWVGTDHRFGKLLDELHWHKKNLFEGKLVDLVMQGDTAAVIFVNKTLNRDRGYAKEVTHVHTGQIEHTHTSSGSGGVGKEILAKLSPGAKRELLDVMRKQAQDKQLALAPPKAAPAPQEAVEAEYVDEE